MLQLFHTEEQASEQGEGGKYKNTFHKKTLSVSSDKLELHSC